MTTYPTDRETIKLRSHNKLLPSAFFTPFVSPPIVQTNPLAAPTPQTSPPAPPAPLQQHKSYPHGELYSIGGQLQSSSPSPYPNFQPQSLACGYPTNSSPHPSQYFSADSPGPWQSTTAAFALPKDWFPP